MRQAILKILMKEKSFVSGEKLCEALGVSRTAIWKHVKELRKAGYGIEGASRKGYRLYNSCDDLSEVTLQAAQSTQWLGRKMLSLQETDSTNTQAKIKAMQGAPHGFMVIAEKQTGGKGRRGRSWVSGMGGVYLSLILRPILPPDQVPALTLIAALALCQTLQAMGLHPGIKWPNDVILEGKKIAGILTEMVADAERIECVIVGIGININQTLESFSGDVQSTVTSLQITMGHPIPRVQVVQSYLKHFEEIYEGFIQTGFDLSLRALYKSFSVTLGKQVKVIAPQGTYEALAVDIDETGALWVETAEGRHRVWAGDVSVRGILGYV